MSELTAEQQTQLNKSPLAAISALTSVQKDAISQLMVDCLQSAFEADPAAMHALICNRVPTSQAMVEHPHVICEEIEVLDDAPACVGMLGVLNGVLEAAGLHKVASKWCPPPSDHPEAPHTLVGFTQFRIAQPAAD
jgi:formate dehydrogenase maturation protein FdhE